jgi:hypothetical protein
MDFTYQPTWFYIAERAIRADADGGRLYLFHFRHGFQRLFEAFAGGM